MNKLWWMRSILREEAVEGGGGGGGTSSPPITTADIAKIVAAEVAKALKTQPTPPPTDPPPTDPPPDPKKDTGTAKMERELAALRKDLDEAKAARVRADEAAKAERRSTALATELGKVGVPAERLDAAKRIFDADLKWTEDGQLVGGKEDQPLGEYLAAQIRQHEYLLPPRQAGGAGAVPGRHGQASVDINDIKPGMSAETRAAVLAQIKHVSGA